MQVHSPQGVVDQIAHRHLIRTLVNVALYLEMGVAPHIKEQVQKILSSKKRDIECQVGETYFWGADSKRRPTAEETEVLQREGYHGVKELCIYNKAMYKSVLYNAVASTSRVDDNEIYTWKDTFGFVVCFVNFEHEGKQIAGVFIQERDVTPLKPAKHMVRVNVGETELHFECMENVRCPVVSIKLSEHDHYLVPMANCYELD
ncbi:hypothetical protein FOCC_FOCC008306 [Frankliniella occidentalis]|nr:hypothetical protein FOCC_FOCC008306 [Frankliniella occidentalis]